MAPRRYKIKKRAEAVEETRRRIIDATFELHTKKGVVATSMQDVAARADVALRTVYNHYPTIEDLVAGCSGKAMSLLSPPKPEIFDGLEAHDERMKRLVHELFAMYERGAAAIEVARCEQGKVAALAAFVAGEEVLRESLAREALRPLRPQQEIIDEVVALTDFYVWKAFEQRNLKTHHAADVVHRSLVALTSPDEVGKRG